MRGVFWRKQKTPIYRWIEGLRWDKIPMARDGYLVTAQQW